MMCNCFAFSLHFRFIRKSVGDVGDLSASPDANIVVCDIPDTETNDNVAHFVTLRKTKRKGLGRNPSTVERKEAYGKENPREWKVVQTKEKDF